MMHPPGDTTAISTVHTPCYEYNIMHVRMYVCILHAMSIILCMYVCMYEQIDPDVCIVKLQHFCH